MVERFNSGVEEILQRNRFDNYNKLIESLNYYLKCYNHFNKQKVLDYKTPAEMIRYWHEKKREIFKEGIDISSYNLCQPGT